MRGLNKPSTDVKEQDKTIQNETISSYPQQVIDENGI
jgi:hypothetical protein